MNFDMKYRNRRKVWWKPGEVTHNPQKLDPVTWKVFCNENMRILPEQSVQISLSFGVEMSEGATMVALTEKLKRLKCGIQNEVVLKNSSDITIIIQNHSTETVSVSSGEELCLLRYV